MKIVSFIFTLLISFWAAYADSPKEPKDSRIKLDYHEAEIIDVVGSMSTFTGKNFLIGDNIKGKITVESSEPVSRDEAYDIFVTALNKSGFCVKEGREISTILPLRQCY